MRLIAYGAPQTIKQFFNALILERSGLQTKENMNRKDFVKTAGLGVASVAILPSETVLKPSVSKLKVAIIGVGARGIWHLNLLLKRNDVEVVGVCDIDPKRITAAKEAIAKANKRAPVYYSAGPDDWKKCMQKRASMP